MLESILDQKRSVNEASILYKKKFIENSLLGITEVLLYSKALMTVTVRVLSWKTSGTLATLTWPPGFLTSVLALAPLWTP